MEERSGVAVDVADTTSGWLDRNETIYFAFQLKDVGAQNWITLKLYDNPQYKNPFYSGIHVLTEAGQGPAEFRYPQVCSSLAAGTSSIGIAEMYTFIEWIPDTVIFISYPNGTLVDPDPLPPDADPEESIDELLGGAQPEDPETEAYGSIGKFRWKLLVMAVGFIMLLGSPIAGIHFGASPASWIKLLFVMCFGLAILSSLKFM